MTVNEIMLWIGVLAGNILRFRFWGYYVVLECYYGRQAMHHTAFIPICHPTLIDPPNLSVVLLGRRSKSRRSPHRQQKEHDF